MDGAAKMDTINQATCADPAITHSVRHVILLEFVVCVKIMLELLLVVDV
jgi:poly(A) polymerase Pap1